MKPKQPVTESDDLFKTRLELVILAKRIDWPHIENELTPFYSHTRRAAIPSRLMVGLHLLKATYALSDEAVCERWVESPYFQYFCGETYFQHRFPIERSSMTHWRHRVGEDFCATLIKESLRIAHESKALHTKHLKRIVVDSTVQPKAVCFPTNVRLHYKALKALVALAKTHNLTLRQSYLRVLKRAVMMSGRYHHAKRIPVVEEGTEWTGVAPERIYVDRGYRGHDYPKAQKVFRSGQKRGVHGSIKKSYDDELSLNQ